MPPGKRGGGSKRSQAESDILRERKRLDRDARQRLLKAGKDVRQYRHEIAALKKAGVISKRVDARSQRVTNYMLRMTRRFEDVLRGDAVVLPARKADPAYWEKGIFEKRGRHLVIPKAEAKQRTKLLRGGKVAAYRPLGYGEERKIYLPYTATDMADLARKLRDDPNLEGMKEGDEQFAFQLFGHNSLIGFPDASELVEYIEQRYQHLFSGANGHKAVKNFVLWRFKHPEGHLITEVPEGSRFYNEGRRRRRHRTPDLIRQQRQEKDRLRKEGERARETPAQKAVRLAEQKERSRKNRNAKYAQRIEEQHGLKRKE